MARLAVGLGISIFSAAAGAYYMGHRRALACTNKNQTSKQAGKNFEVSDDSLVQYMMSHNLEDPVLAKLRRVSLQHGNGHFTTALEVGKLLTLLCKAINAQKVIDIGVFTGCSSYSMALGLQSTSGSKVVACDISSEYTDIGKPYWNEGGVADKIDLRIQPALKTLQDLIDNGEKGTFDVIFIDAVKKEYPQYFQTGLLLLRPGGIIVVDNALWRGKVADSNVTDESTEGIRKMNQQMCDDDRVEFLLINAADGIGIAIKK